jgi:LPXTG-motif cell wall-anchored protein
MNFKGSKTQSGNANFRYWKKGKTWLFGCSVAAALAGSAIVSAQTVNFEYDTANSECAKVDNQKNSEVMSGKKTVATDIESTSTVQSLSSQTARTTQAKADIENLVVTLTDETGKAVLSDGEPVPPKANGSNYAVGARVEFTLNTTGYVSGDTITIPRKVLVNGEASTGAVGVGGAGSIPTIVVTDPISKKNLGWFKAEPGGDVIFTLTASGVAAGELNINQLIPTVLTAGTLPSEGKYQVTVGNSTVNLVVPGSGYEIMSRNSNTSTDGYDQWVSGANANSITLGIRNNYSGHVARQGEPGTYFNSTGGILTNISENPISSIKVVNNNYRIVSFYSNGVLHSTRIVTQKGSSPVMSSDFLSGVNNDVYADASEKLDKSMTLEQAQAALSPGEWGAVDRGDGTWLWAYKTGDPSEGTILDADGYIAALQEAGAVMTDDDIAKTKAQKEFIASTNDSVVITFNNNTKNGKIINSMGNGSLTASNTLPSGTATVPGRIMVSYIDDTSTSVLGNNDDISGTTGETATYSTTDRIDEYLSKGYKLVKDTYSEKQPAVFGKLGDIQMFEVHFVHDTKLVKTETKTINRVIHYYYEGTSNKAAQDKTDSVTFTRTISEDLVYPGDPSHYIYSEWEAKDDDTTFNAVTSPAVDGYTPDKSSIPASKNLTEESQDETFIVYYESKQQNVVYNIIDDDKNGEKLEDTILFDTGDSDAPLKKKQTDLDAIVKAYTDKGYEIVKNSTDSVPASFDHDDNKDQIINIHLKHREDTVTPDNPGELELSRVVQRTIHYLYEDGNEAAGDDVDSVEFTRTAKVDATDGSVISYSGWVAKNGDTTFDAVTSPTIANYTPDKSSIAAVTGLTENSTNTTETVTYKVNTETVSDSKTINRVIHYVYEDGKKAAEDVTETVTFTRTGTKNAATGDIDWNEWKADNDDTSFDEVTSPAISNYTPDKGSIDAVTGITESSNSSEVVVTYIVNTEEVSESRTINRVIHYVFEDGKEAAADSSDSVTFTRTGRKNLATDEVVWNDWTAGNADVIFDAVKSPVIEGYTPDRESIAALEGLTEESADVVEAVTYKKNPVKPMPPDEEEAAPTPEPEPEPETTPAPEPAEAPKPGLSDILPVGKPAEDPKPAQTSKPAAAVLPSTGERVTAGALILGAAFAVTAGFIGVARRLRRNKH